jgi:hypothetical protein
VPELRLDPVLVHEAHVHDPLSERELDEHLLAVVGPAPRELVAPAGAGEWFPAVLGDHRIGILACASVAA